MAIDTAEKRKAISGIGFPGLIPGVTPNAAKDAEWRQQAGWLYSGIAVAADIWTTFDFPPFRYVASQHGASAVAHLEGYMRQTTAIMKMRLYDDTVGSAVADSEISTTSGTLTRVVSDPLTLADGSDHLIQTGGPAGSAGDAGGKVVVVN